MSLLSVAKSDVSLSRATSTKLIVSKYWQNHNLRGDSYAATSFASFWL